MTKMEKKLSKALRMILYHSVGDNGLPKKVSAKQLYKVQDVIRKFENYKKEKYTIHHEGTRYLAKKI